MRQKGIILLPLLIIIFIGLAGYFIFQQITAGDFQINRETDKSSTITDNTSIPTPVQKSIERLPINSDRQNVTLTSPKYSDIADSPKKYFKIVFSKVTPESKYFITSEDYQKLVISDDSYEFYLDLPSDGGLSTFKKVPPVNNISTKQFGNIYRILNPYLYMDTSSTYTKSAFHSIYSSEFNIDCPQAKPKPAACSFMQVEFSNPKANWGHSNIYVECTSSTSEGLDKCDEIISSLAITQIE